MKKYCVLELVLIQYLHTKTDANFGIKQQKTGTEKPQKSASFQFWTESFRPDQKFKTATLGGFLFFCLGRADSNGKLKFTEVRTFPSHGAVHRLWGIPDDFAEFHLRNLLIVVPTRNSKPPLLWWFLFSVWGVRIRTVN